MIQNRIWNSVLSTVLMVLLFVLLIRSNASSPRVDVRRELPSDLPTNRLVLLEGGTITPNEYGGQSLCFTLEWHGTGCLFVPKAGNSLLLVNGRVWDDLQNGKQRLFQFQDAPAEDHRYQVEIRSAGRELTGYNTNIYIGPLSAVGVCIASQIISRYMVTGICLGVLLFSALLYVWKKMNDICSGWLFMQAACCCARRMLWASVFLWERTARSFWHWTALLPPVCFLERLILSCRPG